MVMKYLDPKADLTFKKIFGNHPDRLKNLLNTLQSLNEDELIQQQQYLPTTEELEISGFTDAELRSYDKFWDSVSVERTLMDDISERQCPIRPHGNSRTLISSPSFPS